MPDTASSPKKITADAVLQKLDGPYGMEQMERGHVPHFIAYRAVRGNALLRASLVAAFVSGDNNGYDKARRNLVNALMADGRKPAGDEDAENAVRVLDKIIVEISRSAEQGYTPEI